MITASLTLFIGWILLGLDVNAGRKISSANELKNKADIPYVNEKFMAATKYTDTEIGKHSETEEAKRETLQMQITGIKSDTKFIKDWILSKENK